MSGGIEFNYLIPPRGIYPIPVPFAAGDFTANNAMTWTVIAGGVTTFRAILFGKLLNLSIKVSGTVAGVPSTKLMVKIPNGLISKNSVSFPTIVNSFGTGFQMGFANITAGGTTIDFQTSLPAAFSNWGAGAAEVDFLGEFEVQ